MAPSHAMNEIGGPWRLRSAAAAATGHYAAITPRVRKMVGVVGNAPAWPFRGNCFTDSSRSLRGYTPSKWSRDVDSHHAARAYETRWVAAPAAVQLALRTNTGAIAHGAPSLPAVL